MSAYETLAPIPNKILAAVGGLTYAAGDSPMATAAGTSTSATFATISSGWSSRNMIVNGEMKVAQRGSNSVNATAYTVDQWIYYNQGTAPGVVTASQSATVPNGTFASSLKFDVTTIDAAIAAGDYYACAQYIEGLQCSRISFGTAAAKSLVLSFWVRVDSPSISFPATFTGAFQNSAQNRAWPFTFSVAATATWQQVSVAITGDLTGTWLQTNGVGLRLFISLACGSTYQGTAGAWTGSDIRGTSAQVNFMADASNDFYITGVQLEVGTSPSPFEFCSMEAITTLCERYYKRYTSPANSTFFAIGYMTTISAGLNAMTFLPGTMRVSGTNLTLTTDGTAADYRIRGSGNAVAPLSAVPVLDDGIGNLIGLTAATTGIFVSGNGINLEFTNTTGYLGYSAEL